MTTVFRGEEKKLVSETGISSFPVSYREMATVHALVYPAVGGGKTTFPFYPPGSPAGPVNQTNRRQVNKRKTKVC